MKKVLAAVLLMWSLLAGTCFAEKWAFVAIGDNLFEFSSYRNVLEEIRDQKVNPRPQFPPADFVLACGDISPVGRNDTIYKSVFDGRTPFFFPVRGNHEQPADVRFIIGKMLTPYRDKITLPKTTGVNYFADWKNVRLIVLDQYSDFNSLLNNKTALQWIQNAIVSAVHATHVFIAFHEPIYPADSAGSEFWKMVLNHADKVRAVFAGHEHFYHRQRIPTESGGLYYINVGNAGQTTHSDGKQTIVNIMIDEARVSYRLIQAPNTTTRFKLKDQW